jgi:hypothetical membrane protein
VSPPCPMAVLARLDQAAATRVVSRIPWWAVASAGAAPVLLVGGWTIAGARQPAGYDPIRDTISALAAQGATDRWMMTSALLGVGACHVITAAGLGPARCLGRVVLAGGGVATLLVAAFPQSVQGTSAAHAMAASLAFTAMGAWPAFAGRRGHWAPLLTRSASAAAAAVLLGLVTWFAFGLSDDHRGLGERIAAGAEALWPLAVVLTSRRALRRRAPGTRNGDRWRGTSGTPAAVHSPAAISPGVDRGRAAARSPSTPAGPRRGASPAARGRGAGRPPGAG